MILLVFGNEGIWKYGRLNCPLVYFHFIIRPSYETNIVSCAGDFTRSIFGNQGICKHGRLNCPLVFFHLIIRSLFELNVSLCAVDFIHCIFGNQGICNYRPNKLSFSILSFNYSSFI